MPGRRSPSSTAFRGGRAAKARLELLRALPAICPLCGLAIFTASEAEVDHVVAVANGGAPYARSNLQLTHRACNRSKGSNGNYTNGNTRSTLTLTAAVNPLTGQLGTRRWSMCWGTGNALCGTPDCYCGTKCWPTCNRPDCSPACHRSPRPFEPREGITGG